MSHISIQMENLRKRVNIELVTDEKRLNKLSSKPTYVSSKIFNQDLVAVHSKKERLLLDKPSYVGMCILDLSKVHMYDFHYNYIKKKYPDSQLLFTDTDSLFYHIVSEKDIYEEFYSDRNLFDNSDYPESSKYFFKEVLYNGKTMYHQMNTIRSESHQINSYHLNKVSLSPFDGKRYILDDEITSLAYGHYLIDEMKKFKK